MEKAIKNIIYFTVKALANIAMRFYFRGIERNGTEHIPEEGPFIYAVNHQNAFLDAIIVGGLSPVPTYFMTRSDVFKPPFDWFLDALKMMPIYRIRDGYKSLSKNDAIFDSCKYILADKNALLIFPEGNHGLEYFLRPLTKGLARISLQAQEELDANIKIIPVGLNYFDHFNSGHKLIVKYGTPISVDHFLADYKAHKHTGLRNITQAISEGMKETLLLPTENESYPQQKHIFQRKNQKYSYSRLTALIDQPNHVKPEKSYKWAAWIGESFSIFNFVPILLTKFILKTKVKQKIFHGSIKIAALILIFPFWFLLTFCLVWALVSLKWALIIFGIQIITLVLRREIVRFSH